MRPVILYEMLSSIMLQRAVNWVWKGFAAPVLPVIPFYY